jgi:predicted acylesterase/phospholipase RssA
MTHRIAISFGGGGARAFCITAGIISVLDPLPDMLVAANSGGALAVARWIKGAEDWTPHDLDQPHSSSHLLSAITRRQMLATVVTHMMCKLGRNTWRAIIADLLTTDRERRKHAPDFIAVASRCTVPMKLEELSEKNGFSLEQMCAHSSFVASPALLSLIGPTEKLIPTHGKDYLVDGGFMDNLAVAPLVRRGCRRIIAVVSSPVPLSMDREQWANNDVVNLFGWPNVIGGQACQVFDAADLERTMSALNECNGVATVVYWVVDHHVTVTWVYIGPSPEFMASLPESVRRRVAAVPSFPHVPTFVPTLNVMSIAPFLANVLFLYGRFLGQRLRPLLPQVTVPGPC